MRILQILSLILLIFPGAAQAQEPESYVKLRILPEKGLITPGKEIWIAVEQSIHPEWHTYWQNPGDSGSAPRIEWSLPEGFKIGEIQWPVPRKLPYGPLLNYGYEDNVILLQKLTAPAILGAGPFELTAKIDILVCKEECIPEFSEQKITLNGLAADLEDNSAYIKAAQTKLPMLTEWPVGFTEKDGNFALDFSAVDPAIFNQIDTTTIEFYPLDWGVIDNTATLNISFENDRLILTQARGDRALKALNEISGLLAYTAPDGSRQGAVFTATQTAKSLLKMPEERASFTLISALFFALLGGIILNLMPCVFPVLSIKALSLVKIADKHPELARLHGLAYTAGVVISFLTIAALLIALQAAGTGLGWGFQLQNPVVVTLLAYLLFIIGLNLSGVFEFANAFTNTGGQLTQGQGLSNSFFTGILATIVATPCTAPFMAAAIGFALLQPPLINLSIFAALGFGLALPYLLLSFIPALRHMLPKPGKWMETFKELLAFPMYASAAWLVWVLSQQAGPMGVLGALFGMVAIAFGFWLLSRKPKTKKAQTRIKLLALIAFLIAVSFLPMGEIQKPDTAAPGTFGEIYSAEKLSTLLKDNKPVFVEMTAAWCITCKVNHSIAINTNATKALFKEKNINYLIGDWTNQDPEITKYLNSFGRNGVPLYVYYGPEKAEPKILPQLLTTGIVKDAITDK